MFHNYSIKSGWEAALLTVAILLASPLAQASAIQSQPPEKIFAAACSTCHGSGGRGGDSWVNDVNAPRIAGLRMISDTAAKNMIRNGSDNRGMPGFGPAEITDTELNSLVSWLRNNCGGMMGSCPAPARPSGTEVKVDILDADPWYTDKGVDNANDPYDDTRRVVLGANQYLTVTNTGKTWHTMTNSAVGKDSGFIGYAGNLGSGTGYYYADQSTGLAPGCVRYLCKLHPYMQFEACTAGNTPAEITKASKVAIAKPAVAGSGEVWVNAQSQEESASDTVDGAMQVIDSANWNIKNYIANVGNNPHNAWPGKGSNGTSYVLTANWHDNTSTVINASTKAVVRTAATGAASAHVQVSPGAAERWFVTIMGGVAMQEVDVAKFAAGQSGALVGNPIRGQFSPHGIWFCDDGEHYLTANTLANSVSLYSVSQAKQQSFASTGGVSPLAASVFNGYGTGGCVRAYTNNAGTASVSVYDINPTGGTITRNSSVIPAALRDASGNLKLRDTSIYPVRWVHMPIQTPVSPPDATTHGRFMVTANKASFNVAVTALSSAGNPTAVYTFPAGLGAHGVTYGRKALCDNGVPSSICYYAYVTNTFEDYISVYDLEKVASAGAPGSAGEQVSLQGYGAKALCSGQSSCNVPITTFCPDCRSGAHVGDVPLKTTTTGKYTYLKEEVWLDPLATELPLDLDLKINTGAQGIMVAPAPKPWP
ncbi:MAG: c-type cytochrome [Sulfuricaulis sp.]|uniref:c-type cytochrome n=1 Tax=Sulfuricaulis sp. TaxID=2003553 RepID=UPI0025F112A2|nr:c-type cytochrome [Sulfuricaulis sp.]MCR4346655.1 c-type cytochrome [Sulfuricaulis sp.]